MLWITGAKGLLGSALEIECKAALHSVVASGKELDIGDLEQVRSFVKQHPGIRYIVNCAAFSLVDDAEVKREEAWKTNAIGPENLALIAREIGAKLIHLSTDYVFPGNLHRPLSETDLVAPCNYYGVTKLEGEKRALALSACVLRTSWLFGNGGKNFVAKLLHMLQTQKVIRLTFDQWGRATYVLDLAKAILQMLEREGLYQYANQGVINRQDFAIAMRDEMIRLGYNVITEEILAVPSSTFPTLCKRPVYSAFDTTKIEQHIPIRPWQEALREFLCVQQQACL